MSPNWNNDVTDFVFYTYMVAGVEATSWKIGPENIHYPTATCKV